MAVAGIHYRELGAWLNLERAALIVTGIGCLTLAAALAFEHIGGYQPCELCLKERFIYYASVPAGLAAYLLAPRRPALCAAIIALCGLGFLANAGLAAYHAGVEWRFWTGPTACTGSGSVARDVGSLLQGLSAEPAPRCDVAQFRLLGISFAGYDMLLSLGMAAFTLTAAAIYLRSVAQTPSGVHR